MLLLVHISLTACFGCLLLWPGRTCSCLPLTLQEEKNTWTESVHRVQRNRLEDLMSFCSFATQQPDELLLALQELKALGGSGKQWAGGQRLPCVSASRAVAFPSPPLWSWLHWITSLCECRIATIVEDHVFSIGCLETHIFTVFQCDKLPVF